MPEAKGMWEGLMDFSFRVYATPKMLRFLYALHLLVGLIAGVAWVVTAFQQAPVQGLLALLAALGGYFVWFLYCRVAIELLAAVFRMADAIAPDRQAQQQNPGYWPFLIFTEACISNRAAGKKCPVFFVHTRLAKTIF